MRIFTFGLLLLCAHVCHAQMPAPKASVLDASLLQAIKKQDVARVQSLLENGADANARNKNGVTPLLLATFGWDDNDRPRTANLALIRLLLERGADPNLGVESYDAAMPLMSARQNAPVMKLLLQAGADPNARDLSGQTALHLSCLYGQATLATLQILLEGGADPNARDNEGQTPLMVALDSYYCPWNGKGFEFLADILRAAGADVNAADNKGQTALMIAAHNQQTDNAGTLLAREAEVNARDKQGQTALMKAAQVLERFGRSPSGSHSATWPSDAMVRTLIYQGANVNARDNAGQSALIWIAKLDAGGVQYRSYGKAPESVITERNDQATTVARTLIENGADVSLLTNNGNTALKWAKVRDNQKLVALLQKTVAQ